MSLGIVTHRPPPPASSPGVRAAVNPSTLIANTPTRHRRIEGILEYRTYTLEQIRRSVESVPSLEWIDTFDFAYDISQPVVVDNLTEDVVLVLRKR